MRPYTTPTHVLRTQKKDPTTGQYVDLDLSGASVLFITYKQDLHCCGGNYDDYDTILEKTLDEVTVEPGKIMVPMTQEETGRFVPNKTVYIQCRAKLPDDKALASTIATGGVEDILKKGVI